MVLDARHARMVGQNQLHQTSIHLLRSSVRAMATTSIGASLPVKMDCVRFCKLTAISYRGLYWQRTCEMFHEQGLYHLHSGQLRDIARYTSQEADGSDPRDLDCFSKTLEAVLFIHIDFCFLYHNNITPYFPLCFVLECSPHILPLTPPANRVPPTM